MKKNLLILLFFALIANARAGLLIEPYAGAALSGSWENGAADGDYSGSTIGARLGFQQLGLFGGLDFRKSSITLEEDGQSDEDLDATTYAAVYIFGGEAELDSIDYKEPSGTILGIGYTGLPFLSVNFEMVNWKYDEYDAGVNSGDTDLEGSHYLLSISLPLNL